MNTASSIALSIMVILADPAVETGDRPAALTVQVKSQEAITLTADEVLKFDRTKVTIRAGNDVQTYEGVALATILQAAGVTWGTSPSPWMDCYVVVEAADAYRVVFSIPEIAPEYADKMVLLADRRNGQPFSKTEGPYQIIEEDARHRCRWVRQVTAIKVRLAALPAGSAVGRPPRGAVYLVGIGPGDPELVTLKAARVLKEADCVFCFGYLKDEVARFVPPEKIAVASPLLMGRFRGQNVEELPQDLRERARLSAEETAKFLPQVRALVAGGKRVVFAASGDPTMFCPWSWVTEDFSDLEPIVVPGLSSFNAANAALGQSMTKKSGSVLISAGDHLGIADEHGRLKMMLILFTHRAKLGELLPQLRVRYPADTPIAVVCEASYERQRVIWATLGTIEESLRGKELPHLYLVYVGDGLTPPKAAASAGDRGREPKPQEKGPP